MDDTTQWAYGVMANLFNAFAFWGVFLGSIVLFSLFFYWLRLFFGNLHVSRSASGSSIWFLLVVAKFHHSMVEASVAGFIEEAVLTLCVILFLYQAAKYLSAFLPESFSAKYIGGAQYSFPSQ